MRFKDDLAWIINNRDETSFLHPSSPICAPADVKPTPMMKAEIIACSDCDAPSPPSLSAALYEGWTELAPHEGKDWNYVGLCPDCLENEYTLPRPAVPETDEKPDMIPISGPEQSKGTLFD